MPIPLAVLNDYVRLMERQKVDFWGRLEPLLAGQTHVGERKFGHLIWTNTTFREISRLKAAIADIEGILASIKFQKIRYEPPPRRLKGERRASAE